MKDLSILDSLDSYLDGFEMRLSDPKPKEVKKQREVVVEKEERQVRRSASPSKKIEENYDVVEEVVIVKRTKPKVKKIVETDEAGNILTIRYEEINEGNTSHASHSSDSPTDLFGRIGTMLDETPYDVNASGSYVSESVDGQPVEDGASDLFIPTPLAGPIADFRT